MSEPPAFQFYPKQFVGDENVMLMSTQAVGAHLLLMCVAWQQDPPCTLPNDDQKLAKWARCSKAEWEAIRGDVLAAWSYTSKRHKTRLTSHGLKKEWDKQAARRAQTSDAANKRWQCERNTDAVHAVCPSSSSSSASSKDQERPLPRGKEGKTEDPDAGYSKGYTARERKQLARKRQPTDELSPLGEHVQRIVANAKGAT